MNAGLGIGSAVFLGSAIMYGACSAAESEGTVDPDGSRELANTGGQTGAGGNGAGGNTATGGSEEATGGVPPAALCPTFEPNNAAYCSAVNLSLECGPYPSGASCTCVPDGNAGAWECSGGDDAAANGNGG